MPAELAVVNRQNPEQGWQASENEYLANDEPPLRYIGLLLIRHLETLSSPRNSAQIKSTVVTSVYAQNAPLSNLMRSRA